MYPVRKSVVMRCALFLFFLSISFLHAQKMANKKHLEPFRWNHPLPEQFEKDRVRHGTFESKANKTTVGYNILLPVVYGVDKERRFPVVYLLHGGRPGSEAKHLRMAPFVNDAIEKKLIPPAIYVFVNGGPVSHYDYPTPLKHLGENFETKGNTTFVKELIPHIDKTYRTIDERKGRVVEGYSQGGRGALRTAFCYPELFSAASAGSAGLATEWRIQQNGGKESNYLQFTPGDDAYTLAATYAGRMKKFPMKVLLYSGNSKKDFNWEGNVAYSKFLDSLRVKHEHLLIPECGHSTQQAYTISGARLFQFLAPILRQATH